MASQMENSPLATLLIIWPRPASRLDRASKLLDDNIMNEAQNRERGALAELVAARKDFPEGAERASRGIQRAE